MQVTSESIIPADDEMHALLNDTYGQALEMMYHNREALEAIIDGLLAQPGGSGAGGDEDGSADGENGAGKGSAMDPEVLPDYEGGTLTGDEVRKIVRELGDPRYLAWLDQEKEEFL